MLPATAGKGKVFTMENMIFSGIPSYNWEFIEKKAKSLAKYGVEVSLREIYTEKDTECISIELIFPQTLETGNWEFMGVKTRIDEQDYLVFGKVPAEFNNDSFMCDHCHSDRYRKSVVIIKDTETGEIKQVGKSCLNKYLSSTLSHFSNLLLTIDEIMENSIAEDNEGFFEGFSMFSNYMDVEKFLHCAYTDIVERGYHKRDSYEVQYNNVECTASSVLTAYDKFNAELTAEQKETVKECIKAYSDFVEKQGHSDFSDNVLKLLSKTYIERKYLNMIVFVPTFLLNKRKFEAEKKAKQEQAKKFNASLNNSYLGEVKEKVSVKVRLINQHVYENCWDGYHTSYSVMYTFITEQGNLVQWKTAKTICDDTDKLINDKTFFTLTGTIKECKEFRERFYTVLTRCKVVM